MSQPPDAARDEGRPDAGTRRHGSPLPTDGGVRPGEEVVVRGTAGADAHQRGFDVPATLAGAMAALGLLVLLSAVAGAVFGSIGYQTGVEGSDLGIAGLVVGLVVLVLACLFGGWVAGRLARRRGGLHGLVAIAWLVLLAAALSALAALAGARWELTERLGLPQWFSTEALGLAAILSGLVALLLALGAGWLGGRLGERSAHRAAAATEVEVLETRHAVRRRPGGIGREGGTR